MINKRYIYDQQDIRVKCILQDRSLDSMLKTTHGQMVINLNHVKLTGKFVYKFVFSFCKCIPDFRLIVRGVRSSTSGIGLAN